MPGRHDRDQKDSKQPPSGAIPGSERHRDEQREGGGPRYAGQDWEVADERGDRRFGHARVDDSDPSELDRGEAAADDDGAAAAAPPEDAELADADQDAAVEGGGEREGMQRAGVSRGHERGQDRGQD